MGLWSFGSVGSRILTGRADPYASDPTTDSDVATPIGCIQTADRHSECLSDRRCRVWVSSHARVGIGYSFYLNSFGLYLCTAQFASVSCDMLCSVVLCWVL